MLALAHTGITLSAGVLIKTAYSLTEIKAGQPAAGHGQHYPQKQLNPLAGPLDIRLLLIGSLLPDIIDKPLGMIILRDTLANGRIFAHTLLFLVVITICGTYLWTSRRRLWLLILSFGTLMHLVLDQMWLNPRTLLWPAYGPFLSGDREIDFVTWLESLAHALPAEPGLHVPEIIGGIILALFALNVIRRKRVNAFIKSGTI